MALERGPSSNFEPVIQLASFNIFSVIDVKIFISATSSGKTFSL